MKSEKRVEMPSKTTRFDKICDFLIRNQDVD